MIRVNNQLAFAAEPSVTLGEPSGELTLSITHGNNCSRQVRVTSSKCSIGASAGCTIELREPGVQPVHCVILRGAGKTVVRRWAPNAWLNGQHFVDAVLNSGDELRIAGVSIRVFFESETPSMVRPASAAIPFPAPARQCGESTTLSQLVQRLQEAEFRVQQLRTEVAQNHQNSAVIGEQIKRVERLLRSDSAKKFQKVLDRLHQEKGELERRLAALELRHREERCAWQLELDRVAAELARQAEKYKLEEQKCRSQATRIAELEARSPSVQKGRHLRQLAKARKQLADHQTALTRVRSQLDLQRKSHFDQAQSLEEALNRTRQELEQAREELQSKQHEVLTQQETQEELKAKLDLQQKTQLDQAQALEEKLHRTEQVLEQSREELRSKQQEVLRQQETQDELKSAYANQIAHLEEALQQNIEKYDHLSVQLEVQRAAEQEAIYARDLQIADLERELRQRDQKCDQLADELEQVRAAAQQSGELQAKVDQLEQELQRTSDEKVAFECELERLRAEELPGLQQQIVKLTETLEVTREEHRRIQAEVAATATTSDTPNAFADEIAGLAQQLDQSQIAARDFEAQLKGLNEERTRLMQQITELESKLSERTDACDRLQAALDRVEAAKSADETALAARVTELEAQLAQQSEQREVLQSQLLCLQTNQDESRDARILELQQVLEACQQDRESLREELSHYQATAASHAADDQQRQAALMEERNSLAERCTALESECSQLQQLRQAEQEAALDREHDSQLVQTRHDQQLAQLQNELEVQQSTWQDRESRWQQTIEDLQRQVDELQAAAERASDPVARGQEPDGPVAPSEADAAAPPALTEEQVPDNESWTAVPLPDASGDGSDADLGSPEKPATFDDPASSDQTAETSFATNDEFAPSELPGEPQGPDNDRDYFAADGDPFAVALNEIEVSIHDLQAESAAGENSRPPSPVIEALPAEEGFFDESVSPGDAVSTQPMNPPADPTPPGDAGVVDEPLNEAESQLLARIRALTGDCAPASPKSKGVRDTADGRHDFEQDEQDQPSAQQDQDEERDAAQKERDAETASHELSIEDYMQRLLNRVGTSSGSGEPVVKSQTVVMGEDELSSPHRIETKRSTNPLSKSSNRERTARPITTVELEAMRELANESTRTALSSHAKRSKERTALSTLSTAIILLLASAIFFILSRGHVSLFMLAGVLALAAAIYFGSRSLRSGAAGILLSAKDKKLAKLVSKGQQSPAVLAANPTSAATLDDQANGLAGNPSAQDNDANVGA